MTEPDPTDASSVVTTASTLQRYEASMVLSGVGDALGYRKGRWEFCPDGAQIHKELKKLGGLGQLKIKLPDWKVSDDTVMHLATAEALVEQTESETKEALYLRIAAKYKECMNDMSGRAAGNTCMNSTYQLRPDRPGGYKVIAFNPGQGGCGAAMRAMCIGLRYPRPDDLNDLIAISIESGRMTHNCPMGFLGSLATALFTHYAIQGKKVGEWGAGLLEVLELAKKYVVEQDRDAKQNLEYWNKFVDPWKQFLHLRGIADGKSEPKYEKNFDDVSVRDQYYKTFAPSGWPGACGHDSAIIAYDALLASGDSWEELCKRGVLHGGDNDSTGAIAGACFGALYGFTGVPAGHYEELEYRDRLETLGRKLHSLTHGSESEVATVRQSEEQSVTVCQTNDQN